ncbi:hypothetical protein HCJ46_17095 [Listeria booriae]|uniref:hypothetical protein n=1 Tax=Listeria booriae TaxID=1552123 RepID=UPI001623E27F|nr:hypothetical protein [Listeria booriae]MBC1920470.1 hypothetical protein [Listeria booriae]
MLDASHRTTHCLQASNESNSLFACLTASVWGVGLAPRVKFLQSFFQKAQKGEYMAIVMFADGYLEENENQFIYRFDENKLKDSSALEGLQSDDASELGLSFGHYCETAFIEDGMATIVYRKESEELKCIQLDTFTKNKRKKSFLFGIAVQICNIIAEEYEENGFFVLPVPENFLVDKDNEVHFIYKANEQMPRTGFGFSQIVEHTKRLIIYVLSSFSFDELLMSKKIETEDELLIKIASAENGFSALLEAITSEVEDSEEKTFPDLEMPPVLPEGKGERYPKTKFEEKRINQEKQLNNRYSKPKLKWAFLIFLMVSLLLNVVLFLRPVFDNEETQKLTERINVLENKNQEYSKNVSKAQKLNEEYRSDLKKRDDELERTVEQLKAVLAQNKTLKDALKKGSD